MTTVKINSKKKGNRIELKFAKILSKRFEETFKRVPMSGAWGTLNKNENIREDAKNILSGDLVCPINFKFSIECKARKEFNFWDMLNNDTNNLEINNWIKQAEQDALTSKKEPLLLIHINNRKPFVIFPYHLYKGKIRYKEYTIMRFDYFLELENSFFWEK